MEHSYESLLAGPIGPLFQDGRRKHDLREAQAASLPPQEHPIDDLRTLIHNKVADQHQLNHYDQAIEELRKSLIMVYFHGVKYESGDVFIWFFRATDGFLQLVRQQTQESLAIIAYFSVLLKRSEYQYVISLVHPNSTP